MNRVSNFLSQCLSIGVMGLMCLPVSAATFTSTSGWLQFSYPDNWEHRLTDNTRARYVENVMLQPKGQDFNARRGELVFRVYDPLYIIEEARVLPYSDAERVFGAFVRALPHEREAKLSVETIGGNRYFVARSNSDGVPTAYFGTVASNGYLMVVGSAGVTDANTYPDQSLITLLNSIRLGTRLSGNPRATESVAKWYEAVSRGDQNKVSELSCANSRILLGLVGLAGEMAGVGDTVKRLVSLGSGFDFSGLRFIPIQSNERMSAVRIAGVVKNPNGTIVPFPEYAKAFGSNVLVVNNEGGAWKVCEPLFAQRGR